MEHPEGYNLQSQEAKDDQQDLLDRFLSLDPSQHRIRVVGEETAPPEPKPEEVKLPSLADPAVAEALAIALVSQGKRREAASILLKLSVQMPEKSAYFADLLDSRA